MFSFTIKTSSSQSQLERRLRDALECGSEAPFEGTVQNSGFQLQLRPSALTDTAKFASVMMRVQEMRRQDELEEIGDNSKLTKAGASSAMALMKGDLGGAQDFVEHASKRLLIDKGALPMMFGELADGPGGATIRVQAFPPLSEAIGWTCFALLGGGMLLCLLFLPVEQLLLSWGIEKEIRTADGPKSPLGAVMFLCYFSSAALLLFFSRRLVLFRRNIQRAKQCLRLAVLGK